MTAQNLMPDRLGPYRLLERIGEGGMGVVHRGEDAEGRAVAVKVLRPGVAADPDARRRLGREFETMRRVRSPFVAEVIDADVTGPMPYVVTRYVAGGSLDQVVAASGPLRGKALERLAWGLAEGLAAVHAAGVVHRDLKPGNVVIAGGAPVLIDFGIAHAPDSTRITEVGMFMGTPGYLAPEVVEGLPCGPSADVHSWGSTVAFAATGRPPFGTGSYETIFYRIVGGQTDLAGVPARLMPVVAAALSRDPASRPSAVQLSTQCAAIDLYAADSPDAAAALAGAAAAAAAMAAGSARPAAPGTIVESPAAFIGPPGPAGRGAGGKGSGLRPRTRQLPAMAGRDNFADLLPPVGYAAAAAVQPAAGQRAARQGAVSQPAAGRAGKARDAAREARDAAGQASERASRPAGTGVRRLLGVVTMAIAVAASVLLPVAGTICAMVMIVLLRATDRAQGRLASRRSGRGARLSDLPVMVVTAPWALVRALLGSALLAPLALTCAAIAAAVTIIMVRAHPFQLAGACAAGAFVAFYGFGPGSGKARRQLGRFFGGVARTRFPAALTAVVLTGVAVAVAGAAVTQPHQFWPLTPGFGHMPSLRHLAAQVASRLHHL